MLPALLLSACVAAFLPCVEGEFLNWDDAQNFQENEAYRGLGAAQLRWACTTYHMGVWQPLAWIILGGQYLLGGLAPRTYHFTSIALHGLNTVLVYVLFVQLLRRTAAAWTETSIRIGAAAAALLFGVHPLRAEAVCWVSCQPYLPAVAFCLLSIMAYLRAQPPGGPVSARWLLACFGLFVAAILCKAVAVSLPVVLLILDIYPLRRWGDAKAGRRQATGRILLEKLPFFAVSLAASVWAMAAKEYTETRSPIHEFDLSARVAQSFCGLLFYFWKTLVPTHLLAFYERPPDAGILVAPYAACAAAVIAAGIVLFLLRRRRPAWGAAALTYFLVLLPNLGLVQISQQLATDRYAYLAIIPIMALAAAGIAGLWDRGGSTRAAMALAVAAAAFTLTWMSRRQCAMWNNSVVLWGTVIERDPNCAVAHTNLGEALMARGQYGEASGHLSRATEIAVDMPFAWSNLGVLMCKARRFEDAATCGERALASRPSLRGRDLARTHAMLGEAYAGLRRDEQAWLHTQRARDLGLIEADRMLEYLSRFYRPGAASQPAERSGPASPGGGRAGDSE